MEQRRVYIAGILFFVVIVLAVTGVLLFSSKNSTDLSKHFDQGNLFYRQGEYQKAAESYESLFKLGYANGALFFNLGNAYFKAGDTGRAVLNYERARQFIPRDPDLKANEEFVLEAVEEYQVARRPFLKRIVLDYARSWTVNEWTLWIVLACIVAMGIHLIGLFLSWPRRRMYVGIAGLLIFSFVHIIFLAVRLNYEGRAAVVVSTALATFEPREGATVYFEALPGWKLKVIREQGNWVKVERYDGVAAWMPKDSVERVRPTPAK